VSDEKGRRKKKEARDNEYRFYRQRTPPLPTEGRLPTHTSSESANMIDMER
jgi:hypothetical protein